MTPAEFDATLSDAEVQLTRIKHLYEQWFQGFERAEPLVPRKQFDRALHRMRKAQPRNTALRFRFQSLIQRYTTLQAYWRRVGRQIEEGTYRRDLMKARRRRERRREEMKEERRRGRKSQPVHELNEDSDVDVDDLIAEASDRMDALFADPAPAASDAFEDIGTSPKNSAPPERFGKPKSKPPASTAKAKTEKKSQAAKPKAAKPKSAKQATPPRPPVPPPNRADRKPRSSPGTPLGGKTPPPLRTRARGPGEARIRQIYDNYVAAKKGNNERVDNVDYEKVAKSIKKMVPKLDRKYKGRRVDFEVVVKDGRVGLKPVVKK